MKKIFIKILCIMAALTLLFSLTVPVFANESDAENTYADTEKVDTTRDISPFEEAYRFTIENMDKFLSALAFIASIVLAFAYKKGLIPLVKAALSKLGANVSNFEKSTSNAIEKTEETLRFLSDRFAYCENTIDELSKNLDVIAERVKESEEERLAVNRLKTAMLTEVEMLYDIFMHSSLPQYSKDNVGEKISAMKKALGTGEENG